ncbi:MAG: FHA domain-containing protein [Lachnospiraceae bacterium]|nr:FHA domain-containing protein [Lachnospiraceae bacterium]
MKTEYKRDLQNNYLILESSVTGEEDGYGLRMAEQNQVKGLLPMHESRRDGKSYLYYEITSKQTLENLYEKKMMSYQDILYVLSGLRDTLEDMRRYLLSPQRLLLAPELIYVFPERGGLLFCYYTGENEYPITVLAEFILKRLDHRDRQAITLGYEFFQKASGENFSLSKTLEEVLAVTGQEEVRSVPPEADPFNRRQDKESYVQGDWSDEPEEEDPPVIHRERKQRCKEEQGLADRLFAKVHPAVLLSFLLLVIMIEILLAAHLLSLTEAGGIFFLILSIELLVNRRIVNKNTTKPEEWVEEEESEEYRKIMQEMYQGKEKPEAEAVEETCCLIQKPADTGLRLICAAAKRGKGEDYPEICPGINPLYIGKIKGEADVLLHSPTVSRMHARLEVRDGRCYLKDMNSRNGTFVNGRRLMPQEECEIVEEDMVAFAEIEYRVIRGRRER